MKNNLPHKKLMLWFLVANLLYAPCVQADSSPNVAWENYIPAASLTVLTAVYIYGLLSPCQDLKNQSQCRYWDKDLKDYITVYYPQDLLMRNFFSENDMQLIANETQVPVLVVLESHVKHVPDNIDQLFEHAKLLAPCIIYIEKDMARFTALPFYDFNEFIDDSKGIFRSSCSRLIDQLEKLKKTDESIIVLGIGRGYDRQSIYDMINLGFNVQYEYPSYKERAEFLHMLFSKRSCKSIDIEKLAKKTIAFSYVDLITLVQNAELYASWGSIHTISNCDVDKAFARIICNHELYQCVSEEIFYETCVHEMGHAFMAAHFDEDFILYNATSTPQSTVDDPNDGESLGLTWYGYYESSTLQVDLYERMIMVCLSGKIAEQIFFGLTYGGILNNKNGYEDFIYNPGGADSDLQKARKFANEVYEINGRDPGELLKELYGKALILLLSYKAVIEKGAKILKRDEFITGSQVYNLLEYA